MICFGDIQYELKSTYRMPEETEEEKRAAALRKIEEEKKAQAALEGDVKPKGRKGKAEQKPAEEEEKKEEVKKEPPKPIKVLLYQTSIHDLINSVDKMSDYDSVLSDLGIMRADLTEERLKLSGKGEKDGNER